MTVRVRFAPSPTGSLHLGNARTALFNWLFARRHGGAFVLRIEDTDLDRQVPGAESSILEDLRWLGLDWDEGPGLDAAGPFGPYRQSERAALYAGAAARLVGAGSAYACFCSPERLEEERREQAAAGRTPRYAGRCAALPAEESRRRREAGEPAALRLRLSGFPVVQDLLRGAVDFTSREPSDPVLVRRDGRPTYNFAVVVDDAAMEITHVLRGDDHLSNTPVQIRIYEALGSPAPRFAHLPTVLGPDGAPLSKRHGAVSVAEARRQGYPAEAVCAALMLLGWTPPEEIAARPVPAALAAARFDLTRVSRSPATLDPPRLDHLAALSLAGMTHEGRAAAALPFLEGALGPAADWTGERRIWLGELLDLWSGQVSRYPDYAPLLEPVFGIAGLIRGAGGALREELAAAASREVLRAFREAIAAGGPLVTPERYQEAAREAGRRASARGRALFHPLRLAVTAAGSGPELQRLVPLIERGARLSLPRSVPSLDDRLRLALEQPAGGGGTGA